MPALLICLVILGLGRAQASATLFGTVSGTVRDPHGLPVTAASVRMAEPGSTTERDTTTDGQGHYVFAIEPGRYELRVSAPGFRPTARTVEVRSGDRLVVDARLEVGPVGEQVVVHPDKSAAAAAATDLISRSDLAHIPGALRAGSRAAIIATAPSAVVAHDQLHIRGGHEVGYEIDGVPIPSNTIGSSLALLFDPKDVQAIEFRESVFSAAYGDRLHGQVNVVTRSGFERPRAVELTALAGQQDSYDGAVSYGDHSDKLAYFVQASGNRTGFGLTPPSLPARHDDAWGLGAAGKLWAPVSASNLFTLTAMARGDNFQVPFGAADQTAAAPDSRQAERDVFVAGQWHHVGAGRWTVSVTPYYHFNRVGLDAGGLDGSLLDSRRIHYLGAKTEAVFTKGGHQLRAGADFHAGLFRGQFNLPAGEGGAGSLTGSSRQVGLQPAGYVEDRFSPTPGITLTAGLRAEQSRAYLVESAVEPRAEVSAAIPGTPLTAHASVGRFFLPPPLEALGVGGAQFAELGDQAFLLVRAERNTQWEAGLSAALAGMTLEWRYYHNDARHFLDHQQLGDSAVFLPVNIAQARLRGMEVEASSRIGGRLRLRLVYALGYAQARGGITGGLGNLSPGDGATDGYYYLDHDQRHTATGSAEVLPTTATWIHFAVHYGSGLLRDDGPGHLPPHVTADTSVGFAGGPHWSVAVEVENLADRRYFVNLSSEFNGTHVARPRTATARLRLTF